MSNLNMTESERNQVFMQSEIIRDETYVAHMDKLDKQYVTLPSKIEENTNKITDLTEDLKETNAQLSLKANEIEVRKKNSPIMLSDLHTDVKSAMTGGSVAVVGEGAVGKENIKDLGVGVNNIDPFIGKNLFNIDGVVDNHIVGANGTITQYDGYCVTDFIEVLESETYVIELNRPSTLGVYFDSNKNVVSVISGANSDSDKEIKEITIPNGVKYIRVNIKKDLVDLKKYRITLKSDFKLAVKIALEWLVVNGSNIDENTKFALSNIIGYNVSKCNLFNKENVNLNQYTDDTGSFLSNSGYPHIKCTNFVEVEPLTTYCVSNAKITNFLNEYDEDKTFLIHRQGVSEVKPYIFTTTEKAKYIVFNINVNDVNVDDTYIVKSTTAPVTVKPYHNGNSEIETFEWLDEIIANYIDANLNIIESKTEKTLERFYGKTLLVSGDSITEKNSRADKNWHDYLKEWLNIGSVINDGKSGTGLVKSYGGAKGMVDRIDYWSVDLDYIIIMGNMNDGTSGELGDVIEGLPVGDFTDTDKYESVYGALHYLFQSLIEKYPDKPILYVSSTPRSQIGARGKCWGIDGWYSEYVKAQKDVCNHYSIPFLDLYHKSGLRPWNDENNAKYFSVTSNPSGDGIHPNHLGQEVMALKIYEFVKQYM